jgi:hypothetical protein
LGGFCEVLSESSGPMKTLLALSGFTFAYLFVSVLVH